MFLCLCFVKRPKKAIFLQFERFLNFFPPKGLSLKSFISSYSVFFCGFPFCLPFQNSIFSLLFVHQPRFFFRKHYYFGFLIFFIFLPFPCLMFACFSETNFPNIPFLKPRLLSFLAGYFSVVAFVFVFMVYVSAFCCLVSCFAFSLWKHNFPCNSGVFLKLSWLKSWWFFMFDVLVLDFFVSCVVCLQSKQWSCIVLCLCCLLSFLVNKTKWFPGLHLVVLILYWLFCVFFFISFKKDPTKPDTAKTPKTKNAEKMTNIKLS